MKRISHSYFVVMVDHGKLGLEAIVKPEQTRRAIIEMLATGESKHVAFVHHVDGLFVEDVTNELFDEAETVALVNRPGKQDAINAAWDHARDLRKHSEAV